MRMRNGQNDSNLTRIALAYKAAFDRDEVSAALSSGM